MPMGGIGRSKPVNVPAGGGGPAKNLDSASANAAAFRLERVMLFETSQPRFAFAFQAIEQRERQRRIHAIA
jgi:hypothetical protein